MGGAGGCHMVIDRKQDVLRAAGADGFGTQAHPADLKVLVYETMAN